MDAAGGGAVGVTDFVVEVVFEPPFEIYTYEYPARAWTADLLYYSAPPSNYAATTIIRANGPGVVSSTPLQFTNQEYWELRAGKPTGSLMDHTFEVEWDADAGAARSTPGRMAPEIGIESMPGEIDMEDASTWVGPAFLVLGFCGLVLVLVVGVGVVAGSRRRKRRQPAPGDAARHR